MTGVEGMRCRLAQLRVPRSRQTLELIEFLPPPGEESRSPTQVGHGHVAFAVDDLPEALADLKRLGAEPLGLTATFAEGRAVYLREPAGSIIELTEIDPESVVA
jgi:hypothetical protein